MCSYTLLNDVLRGGVLVLILNPPYCPHSPILLCKLCPFFPWLSLSLKSFNVQYSCVPNKHVYTLNFLTFFSSIHFLIRYYTFINFVFIIQATWSIQNIFSMKLCFWYMLFQILIKNNQINVTILIYLRKIETLMLMI